MEINLYTNNILRARYRKIKRKVKEEDKQEGKGLKIVHAGQAFHTRLQLHTFKREVKGKPSASYFFDLFCNFKDNVQNSCGYRYIARDREESAVLVA